MELQKIKGNSYVIMAPTNIGVYSFKNKNCLLVDTGIDNTAVKKIDETLEESTLHPKFIVNTHSHVDHFGGNNYLRDKYTGILTYSSHEEILLMENGELNSEILFSSCNAFSSLDKLTVKHSFEAPLKEGENKIGDDKFNVFYLPGHSKNCVAIATGDKVCYLGDSIFSEEILDKYKIPNLINVKEENKTLDKIKEIDCDYFVIGHSSKIYTKEEIDKLVLINKEALSRIYEEILEFLQEPLTREDLVSNMTVFSELPLSFKECYLLNQTISSFLSYLYERGEVTYQVEDGKVYFYSKER